MTHRTEIQLRFFDSDAFGHLSNIAFSMYVEQARTDFFFGKIGLKDLILARLELDIKKQAYLQDRVYVETSVLKIGNTSVIIKQDIMANDNLVVSAKSVIVLYDYEQQTTMRIPDWARAQLSKYLIESGD